MKSQLKKIFAISALVCACTAQADDVACSGNVFGLMTVVSPNANTIVGTPWLAADGSGAVAVSNLVKTTNLTVGDKLYLINGSGSDANYDGWELVSGGYWAPIAKYSVASNGTMSSTAGSSAADRKVVRGQGVWLYRQNPVDGGNAKPFYVYGLKAGEAASTAVIQGTENAPAWNLIASASTSAFSLSSMSGANAKDTIVIPTGNAPIVVEYKNSAWSYSASSNYVHASGVSISVPYTVTNPTIPAGTGFWYVSRGGNPTINW